MRGKGRDDWIGTDRNRLREEGSVLGRGFVRTFNLAVLALIGAASVVIGFVAVALMSAQ